MKRRRLDIPATATEREKEKVDIILLCQLLIINNRNLNNNIDNEDTYLLMTLISTRFVVGSRHNKIDGALMTVHH
jgi:hypothetical protein